MQLITVKGSGNFTWVVRMSNSGRPRSVDSKAPSQGGKFDKYQASLVVYSPVWDITFTTLAKAWILSQVLQAIVANLASGTKRGSGKLGISQLSVGHYFHAKASRSAKLCLMLQKYGKTFDSP